ncbi:MAG TPA: hypothetical protein VFF30_10485 [Nitrososphaerales archaeon]|nr:hypothetical protein [Nitrososphaerales archaeon]
MTISRAPLKLGDTVYHKEMHVRARVLGRLKQWVILEIEGTHEKLRALRGDLKLVHTKM